MAEFGGAKGAIFRQSVQQEGAEIHAGGRQPALPFVSDIAVGGGFTGGSEAGVGGGLGPLCDRQAEMSQTFEFEQPPAIAGEKFGALHGGPGRWPVAGGVKQVAAPSATAHTESGILYWRGQRRDGIRTKLAPTLSAVAR